MKIYFKTLAYVFTAIFIGILVVNIALKNFSSTYVEVPGLINLLQAITMLAYAIAVTVFTPLDEQGKPYIDKTFISAIWVGVIVLLPLAIYQFVG